MPPRIVIKDLIYKLQQEQTETGIGEKWKNKDFKKEEYKISPSTIKVYFTNIRAIEEIAFGQVRTKSEKKLQDSLRYIGDLDFLLDPDDLNTKFMDKNIPIARILNYYNAIINILGIVEDRDETFKIAKAHWVQIKGSTYDSDSFKSVQGIKPKQEENFCTWKSITDNVKDIALKCRNSKCYDRCKLSRSQYHKLQDYVIALLYTEIPPSRADYSPMTVITDKEYTKLESIDTNYLVEREDESMYFIFSQYKTAKKYKILTEEIDSPRLLVALKHLIFHNNSGWLLVGYNMEKPLTQNQLSKLVAKIFSKADCNLGITMLRKIYLSDKYGPTTKMMADDAKAMKHSVAVQQSVYIKPI